MTDDELTLLHRRIEDMIAAPLAVVVGAIDDLERLRAELEAELASHRSAHLTSNEVAGHETAVLVDRRAAEGQEARPIGRERRRRPLPAPSEPIAVNRKSFQS